MTETVNIHRTEGRNLTEVLPDRTFEDTRRELIALRVKHGANSPIGHRCSNLIEQLQNLGTSRHAARAELLAKIHKTSTELARLTSQ